jgi:hypothetical protein
MQPNNGRRCGSQRDVEEIKDIYYPFYSTPRYLLPSLSGLLLLRYLFLLLFPLLLFSREREVKP